MKKIFTFLSAMLLSVAFMQAQTEYPAFTIYPSSSGDFYIFYSTVTGAPSTNTMEVDWGDGVRKKYNGSSPSAHNPKLRVTGTATKGKAIKVYSKWLHAFYIKSPAEWITPYLRSTTSPNLQYFYYLDENLSEYALENLYQGLNDRTGSPTGELYIINEKYDKSEVPEGAPVRKANAFVTKDKNWNITSFSGLFNGTSYQRIYWQLGTDVESISNFIRTAFYLQGTAGKKLHVGSMDMRGGYYGYGQSPITIVSSDGSIYVHRNQPEAQKSETAFSTTGRVTATVGGPANQMFVYGAGVTHFSCDNAFYNGGTLDNLRYIEMYYSRQDQTPNGLSQHKKLKYLSLYRSEGLLNLKVPNAQLEVLNLEHCSKLKTLSVGSTKLKELRLAFTPTLPVYQHPDYSKLTALKTLRINNCKLSACDLDAIYFELPTKTSTHYVKVSNMSTSDDANDYQGANHTIATAKKWQPYGADEGGSSENYSYDGGGCVVAYKLWIIDTQVTSANASNITGYGILGGKVSYDRVTRTLTLNRAKIRNSYTGSTRGCIRADENLNIKLIGENIIENCGTGQGIEIYLTSKNLKIIDGGTGKLYIRGCNENTPIAGNAIEIGGELRINACYVDGYSRSNAIDSKNVIYLENGARLNVHADYNYFKNYAIKTTRKIEMSGNSSLLALGEEHAIYSPNGINTYPGAVLMEGNGYSQLKKVSKLTFENGVTKHKCVYIRPTGTDVETLTSQGIQVQGVKSAIRISIDTDEHKYASIYNLAGALVRVAELEGKETTIGNMQPGIYIVRIGNAAEKVVVK